MGTAAQTTRVGKIGMATSVLIDTDILIDVARGDPPAITFLETLFQNSSCAISSVTEMELIVGCRNKRELSDTETFLSSFNLLRISADVSDRAVLLLKQYRLSHGLLIPDALIAATALTHNSDFVTKNQRDYRFVGGLNLRPYP